MSPDDYYELANSFGFDEPDDGFDEERVGDGEPIYDDDDQDHMSWQHPYGDD